MSHSIDISPDDSVVISKVDLNESKKFSLKNILYVALASALLLIVSYFILRHLSSAKDEEAKSVVFEEDFKDYLIYFELKGETRYRDLVQLNLKTNEKISITNDYFKNIPHLPSNPKVSPDGKMVYLMDSSTDPKEIFTQSLRAYNCPIIFKDDWANQTQNEKLIPVPRADRSNDSYCLTNDKTIFIGAQASQHDENIISEIYEFEDSIDNFSEGITNEMNAKYDNLIVDYEDNNLIFCEEPWGKTESKTIFRFGVEKEIIRTYTDISFLKLSFKNKLLFAATGQKICEIYNLSKDPIVSKKVSLKGYNSIMNVQVSSTRKYLYIVAKELISSDKSSLVIVENFDFELLENDNVLVGYKYPNLELEVDEIAITFGTEEETKA